MFLQGEGYLQSTGRSFVKTDMRSRYPFSGHPQTYAHGRQSFIYEKQLRYSEVQPARLKSGSALCLCRIIRNALKLIYLLWSHNFHIDL